MRCMSIALRSWTLVSFWCPFLCNDWFSISVPILSLLTMHYSRIVLCWPLGRALWMLIRVLVQYLSLVIYRLKSSLLNEQSLRLVLSLQVMLLLTEHSRAIVRFWTWQESLHSLHFIYLQLSCCTFCCIQRVPFLSHKITLSMAILATLALSLPWCHLSFRRGPIGPLSRCSLHYSDARLSLGFRVCCSLVRAILARWLYWLLLFGHLFNLNFSY